MDFDAFASIFMPVPAPAQPVPVQMAPVPLTATPPTPIPMTPTLPTSADTSSSTSIVDLTLAPSALSNFTTNAPNVSATTESSASSSEGICVQELPDTQAYVDSEINEGERADIAHERAVEEKEDADVMEDDETESKGSASPSNVTSQDPAHFTTDDYLGRVRRLIHSVVYDKEVINWVYIETSALEGIGEY